jgi:hypothetical protein
LAAGSWRKVRFLILHRRENQNHQMCQLDLSLMNKMEPEVDSFGDATEPLHAV